LIELEHVGFLMVFEHPENQQFGTAELLHIVSASAVWSAMLSMVCSSVVRGVLEVKEQLIMLGNKGRLQLFSISV
jgi:hypothetical protein